MIDVVKELFQVQIYHPLITVVHVMLHLIHSLMCAPSRAESKTAFGEARVKDRCQYLRDGLLNQAVLDGRNAQWTLPAAFLGDFRSPHGKREVVPFDKAFLHLWPFLANVLRKSIDSDAIHSARTAIGFNLLPGGTHIGLSNNI